MKTNTVSMCAFYVVGMMAMVMSVSGVPCLAAEKEKTEDLTPMTMIKKNTNEVLAIFRDPDLQAEDKREERRKKVRAAVQNVFDWAEISKRAVGRKWWEFSKEQKKEFTGLFRQLLENTYLRRIKNNVDARVKYLGEKEDEGYWTVNIMAISRDGKEVPITYKLYTLTSKEQKKKEAKHPWLIYDVKIEGVSLVSNYRSQFRDILLGNSIDEMIEKLRKKVKSQQEQR